MAAELAALDLLFFSWILLKAIILFVWKPYFYRRAFVKQGVACLPYHFVFGNLREISAKAQATFGSSLPVGLHDLIPRLLPQIQHWKNIYGNSCCTILVHYPVSKPALYVNKPEWVKEVLYQHGNFTKIFLRPRTFDLVGRSVASLNGEEWAQHRRAVSPAFFTDKLKMMTPVVINCITDMLYTWENQVDACGKKEINVHDQFKILTADVIAHAAFGSNYEEGKVVLKLQNEQQNIVAQLGCSSYIPGSRFIPTPTNLYWWKLSKMLRQTIKKIIDSRGDDYKGNDFLGILMAVNKAEQNIHMRIDDIIDECKTFFIGGYDTTSTLMTWTTMLLAINPEWQERVRKEVFSVCGKKLPTYETLHSLKTVGMVLNEALRLYPPGVVLVRQASKQITLGNITIPPETMLLLPTLEFHHDTKYWGKDALEFNPDRFANGISNASTTSAAFLPFSMGPRTCLGQNFALSEARTILVLMLQRFRFSLSPGYKHSPKVIITIQPEHGMQIVFERV